MIALKASVCPVRQGRGPG